MFSVKCKFYAIKKTTLKVFGLRTRVHVRNLSMHEIAAYKTCKQTYFYVHEKNVHTNFEFFKP